MAAHHAILRDRMRLRDTPPSNCILKPFNIQEPQEKVRRVFGERAAAKA